eukprot:7125025-Heterocapsa_arctica.AAC.1
MRTISNRAGGSCDPPRLVKAAPSSDGYYLGDRGRGLVKAPDGKYEEASPAWLSKAIGEVST